MDPVAFKLILGISHLHGLQEPELPFRLRRTCSGKRDMPLTRSWPEQGLACRQEALAARDHE